MNKLETQKLIRRLETILNYQLYDWNFHAKEKVKQLIKELKIGLL